MNPIKVIIQGNDPKAKAVLLMLEGDLDLLPVLQDDKLAGIIRLCDLFVEISDFLLQDQDLR